MKIQSKQIAGCGFIVVGHLAVSCHRVDGFQWDENLKEVVVLVVGGKRYRTGYKDKESFMDYITPKPKKGEPKQVIHKN